MPEPSPSAPFNTVQSYCLWLLSNSNRALRAHSLPLPIILAVQFSSLFQFNISHQLVNALASDVSYTSFCTGRQDCQGGPLAWATFELIQARQEDNQTASYKADWHSRRDLPTISRAPRNSFLFQNIHGQAVRPRKVGSQNQASSGPGFPTFVRFPSVSAAEAWTFSGNIC